MQIHIEGIEGVTAMLDGFVSKMEGQIERGLAKGGEIVSDEAKARCPESTEKTRPKGPHGELRASIASQAQGLHCEVGTNKEYGAYVEFGTYKMAAQPYLVPALHHKRGEVISAVREELGK
ncbi:MAG: HK97 gp10 family phage protein [Clostridiales bacterium]|nr:HK97 gp10 family phage protein [Clostridiales bacterium]